VASDPELLEKLGAWDPAAGEAFVQAHYRGLYRFFLWLTNDPEAASDLTQESFAAFWHSVAGPAGRAVPDLKAWLYGIARNRWRKRRRDDRTDHLTSAAPVEEAWAIPDGQPCPEALVLARIDAEEAADAVAVLPPDLREALVLRVFEELSYAQIAAALGISENLARWRAHRARKLLAAALRGADEKEGAGATCG
jgi:RNA polymerase sigma-70 factor (ECF subfamily)